MTVTTCRRGHWQELGGGFLEPSPFRGTFQDFIECMMCTYSIVLTFKPWMLPCIHVNCLFIFSGKSSLGLLAKCGPYCFLQNSC